MEVKFRVEYEATPIRHVAVQCPYCDRWFVGYDILQEGELRYEYDLEFAKFHCPMCERDFQGYNPSNGLIKTIKVEECGSNTEVYKYCFKKKVVWE